MMDEVAAGPPSRAPLTVLCLASYEKGADFIRACKRQGARVILLTVTALEEAPWPRESIDECFYMPDLSRVDDVIVGVSYLARSRTIDRIIALDDYDVETAAALREHLRLPGMGSSRARLFRDKLAMRVATRDAGIRVPDFVPILNDDRIHAYITRVPPPWVLKPRSEVSTIGIARIESLDGLGPRLDALGDRRSFHLLERYVPGAVYHVDSIVYDREVVFAEAHQYGRPPLDVYHGGGLFITRTLARGSEDEQALTALNRQVIVALGMERGITHAEFIKGHDDGAFYFLEIGARAGGAAITEVIAAATGINPWIEWARIETLREGQTYRLPARRHEYAGIIISLARQEYPDTTAYADPEIVWRLHKRHHVGLCVRSDDPRRVQTLLDDYSRRIQADFSASLPPYTGRPPIVT